MKALISVVILLVLSIFTFLASVQADEKTTKLSSLSEIKLLKTQLTQADYDLSDRNTRLRLQRAVFYYHSSIRHLDEGWEAKARDQAERGLNLLALQNISTSKTPVVNM